MTVLLDLAGASGVAFFNLLTISGDDGGLGLTDQPGDATVFLITYDETAGQPATADRLNQLVNNNFGAPVTTSENIVVTAMNGGNDPYSGQDVTGNGITYIDSTGGTTVIRVVYDVSQCCGQGLALFDTGGNAITAPNPVILYHELSHAFRGATGTQQPNDEPPAETDENVLRSQLGLCLRDVNNHNGQCGPGNDCGGSDGGPDGGPPSGGCAAGNNNGCFIVSAATGSPTSLEVYRLRQLRHRISTTSVLGKNLIDVAYGEYQQFSPEIANEIKQDALLREAVLAIVVRPLLAWYDLAGSLAFDKADDHALTRARQALSNSCPTHLGRSIVPLLDTLRSGESLPPHIQRPLLDVMLRLQPATHFRFASWAILDALMRAWRASAWQLDVAEEVAQWLGSAPIEELAPPSSPDLLEKELALIVGFLDFQPGARKQLGERLLAAWPEAADALIRHGFDA